MQRRMEEEFGSVEVLHKGKSYQLPLATVRVLMDDYCVISPPQQGERAQEIMREVLQELGLPRQMSKGKEVSSVGEYLGWWLDSAKQALRLPPDKVAGTEEAIRKLLLGEEVNGEVATFFLRKELESLIGKLTHAHLVFPRTRPFINSLLACQRSLNHQFKRGSSNPDLRRSAEAFLGVLRTERPFADLLLSHDGSVDGDWACGDAAGDGGMGYFSERGCRTHAWGVCMATAVRNVAGKDKIVSSTLQESACMAVAFLEWARSAPIGSTFTYLTDAANLAHNWKRGRSSVDRINSLLMLVAEASVERDLQLRVFWHSRTTAPAKLADSLSRGVVQAYQVSSLMRNRSHGSIPGSVLARVRASLLTPTSSSTPTSQKRRLTDTTG